MGVAGFYRWLVQRYPLVRHRTNDLAHPKINNFYIDFNCIVYNSIRQVKPEENGDNTILFNEICRYVDLLVQIIKPDSLIYIAVDGPAPLAKCAQQRSRRFVAARDHQEGTFSTAAISVGTEFMEELHVHLEKFIKSRIENDSIWAAPKVIYSSHRTPGEGEHKFFNYLREEMDKPDFDRFSTHCIFSPDADLVFLTLQTGLKNFYIMREWTSWMGPNENMANGELDKMRVSQNDFELLHCPILRDYLHLEFPESDVDRLITDFVAIAFLIGNDFIPHFPEINITNGDFDSILKAYRQSLLDRRKYLITEDIEYDTDNLEAFLKAVVANVKASDRSNGNQKPGKGKKNAKPTQLYTVPGAQKYLQQKYKSEYSEDFEMELCCAVIDSFNWVLNYYFKGCCDYTWQFSYFYAPPIILVAEYCTIHESNFELGRPPLPFEQLLSILPPKMSHLLPYPIACLMSPPSPIAEYYPEEFEIDLNGRKFEHEGVTLIPFVDIEKLRTEVSKALGQLSDEEKKRNTFDEMKIMNEGTPKEKKTADPPGLPSLSGIKFEFENSTDQLKIFDKPSKYPSLFVVPNFDEVGENEKYKDIKNTKELFGKLVLFDWPFLRPGVVVGSFNKDGGSVIDEKTKTEKTFSSDKNYKTMLTMLRNRRGIEAEKSSVGLIIKPYVIKSIDGTIKRSNEERLFPAELIFMPEKVDVMKRYLTPPPPKYPEVGSRIIITEPSKEGQVAQVTRVNLETGDVTAKVILSPLFNGSFLANDNYTLTMDELAHDLEMNKDLIKCMLESVRVLKLESDLRDPDVGLTLFRKDQVLDGITFRTRDGNYLFAKEALNLIKQYLEISELENFYKHKAKVEFKDKTNQPKLVIFADNLAAKTEKQIEKVETIQNWIHRESPIAGLFLIGAHIAMVTRAQSELLEVRLNKTKFEESEGSEVTLKKGEFLIKGMFPDRGSLISIGDRVTSIAPNGPVPFGTHGTVIGFDHHTLEAYVVADTPFQLGSTMRMRLKSQRGFVANIADLIPYN